MNAKTNDQNADDDDDFDIVIEDEGGATPLNGEESSTVNAGAEEKPHEDEDDEDAVTPQQRAADDEAIAGAKTDDEREAIRERRRQERHEKKQKQREREENLRRELAARDSLIEDMRSRLDAVERKNHGTDVAQLDAAINETARAYEYFKQQIDVATKSQNGVAMADATEKMIIARQRIDQLKTTKDRLTQMQTQPAPLDPRLKTNAEDWLSKNRWFDIRGTDVDSRVVMDEDERLTREGWNPNTKEYWDELTERLKKRLPHKYSRYNPRQESPNGNSNRAPVAGSGKEDGGGGGDGSKRKTVRLSPERVAAMKEAGIWDDVKARNAMIKKYQEYDAAQRQSQH
jgi:hypothetical protein